MESGLVKHLEEPATYLCFYCVLCNLGVQHKERRSCSSLVVLIPKDEELIYDCQVSPWTNLFAYMLGFLEHNTNQAIEIIFLTNKHNIVGCFVTSGSSKILIEWTCLFSNHWYMFYQWFDGFDPFRECTRLYFFMSSPLSGIIFHRIHKQLEIPYPIDCCGCLNLGPLANNCWSLLLSAIARMQWVLCMNNSQ